MEKKIKNPTEQLSFATAGKATFTIQSPKTGIRRTYKISLSDDGEVLFVSVLRGPSNESDFSFMAIIRAKDGRLFLGKKSGITTAAIAWKAFEYWYRMTRSGRDSKLSFWHHGQCGRCGRKLTVPESIESGLGPHCAVKANHTPNMVMA